MDYCALRVRLQALSWIGVGRSRTRATHRYCQSGILKMGSPHVPAKSHCPCRSSARNPEGPAENKALTAFHTGTLSRPAREKQKQRHNVTRIGLAQNKVQTRAQKAICNIMPKKVRDPGTGHGMKRWFRRGLGLGYQSAYKRSETVESQKTPRNHRERVQTQSGGGLMYLPCFFCLYRTIASKESRARSSFPIDTHGAMLTTIQGVHGVVVSHPLRM